MATTYYSRARRIYRRDDVTRAEAIWDEEATGWADTGDHVEQGVLFGSSDVFEEVPEAVLRLVRPEIFTDDLAPARSGGPGLSPERRSLVTTSALLGEGVDALLAREAFSRAEVPAVRSLYAAVEADLDNLPPGAEPEMILEWADGE